MSPIARTLFCVNREAAPPPSGAPRIIEATVGDDDSNQSTSNPSFGVAAASSNTLSVYVVTIGNVTSQVLSLTPGTWSRVERGAAAARGAEIWIARDVTAGTQNFTMTLSAGVGHWGTIFQIGNEGGEAEIAVNGMTEFEQPTNSVNWQMTSAALDAPGLFIGGARCNTNSNGFDYTGAQGTPDLIQPILSGNNTTPAPLIPIGTNQVNTHCSWAYDSFEAGINMPFVLTTARNGVAVGARFTFI